MSLSFEDRICNDISYTTRIQLPKVFFGIFSIKVFEEYDQFPCRNSDSPFQYHSLKGKLSFKVVKV